MWLNKMHMIGRKEESNTLQRAIDSNRAQIVVVYGRHRVGKTFLINEFFSNKYTFKHTAVSPIGLKKAGQMKIQLEEFYYSLKVMDWKEEYHVLRVGLKHFTFYKNFLTTDTMEKSKLSS